MQERVTFQSGDVNIVGELSIPEAGSARKPTVIVMHGFGGHRDGPQQRWSQAFYTSLGYAVLRFDFEGCGESGGERGWVLPFRQVKNALSALDYLSQRPEIDDKRICMSGTSFGASVAVYCAGLDKRVAAVIGQGGLNRAFRGPLSPVGNARHPRRAFAKSLKNLAPACQEAFHAPISEDPPCALMSRTCLRFKPYHNFSGGTRRS